MTAIAALKENGVVYIGGDSAGVGGGYSLSLRKDPKVFKVGQFVIGYTSSFRMGQVLRFGENGCLKLDDFTEKQIESKDPFEFMVRDFVPRIRYMFKEAGFASVSSNAEKGGTFLVGWKGHLFKIESDFQVGEPIDAYDACGCGEKIAVGALSVLKDLDIKAQQKVRKSLEAAEHHSAGVRGPFLVLNT